MKSSWIVLGAALVGVAGAVPLAFGLLDHKGAEPVGPKPFVPAPMRVIILSPAALQKNPIVTAGVVETKLAPDLQVVGSVTYDQDHFALVGPLVPGRIVALKYSASLGSART